MDRTEASEARPSDEEIAQRAYELYLQRGSAPGHETDDWLQAEAELIEARRNTGAPATPEPEADSEPAPGARRRGNGRRDGAPPSRRSLRQ